MVPPDAWTPPDRWHTFNARGPRLLGAGDRARDVDPKLADEAAARLERAGARPEWPRMVREVVALDDAQRREMFGEALPSGLRLVE